MPCYSTPGTDEGRVLAQIVPCDAISGAERRVCWYQVKDCIARGKNGGYARRYEVKVGLEKEEMLPVPTEMLFHVDLMFDAEVAAGAAFACAVRCRVLI